MRMSPWLTIFIGLSLYGVGLDALSFTTQPLSQDVTQGRQITLQCAVDEKGASFDWRLDGGSVDGLPGVSIQDGNLVISSVDRNAHQGSFTCVVSSPNQNQPIISEPAVLNIIWIRSAAVLALRSPQDSSSIQEGSRVTMTCKADGNPTPTFTFFRDSTELSSGGNVEITGNRLRLQQVTTADNGVYSCKAENRGGTAWTERGNITISIRGSNYPTIVVQPEDQMVLVGGDAFFHCQFSGSPTPSVEWYKYKGEVNEGLLYNDTGTVIFPNGTLVLENIQTVDQGTYKCLCKSPFGEPSVSAKLRVSRVEPLPVLRPLTVAEGSPQSMLCAYPPGFLGGIPTPTLQWSKPGSTLSSDDTQRVYVVNGSLLVFNSMEKSDEGNYTCTASNSAGEEHSYLYITVATTPQFTVLPTDIEVRESDPAHLDCQAEADPEPTIKWLLDGVEMSQNQFTRILDNGTLVFYNPSQQNGGTYVCVASNIATSSEASAVLTVKAILRFNPKPVGSTQFELGNVEKINCRATAATTPNITWMKDQQEEASWNDDHVTIENGMLMFDGAKWSDAGTYTCIARSDDEEINATIKVEVYIKPKFTVKPQNTTVFEGHSLSVTCEAYGDPEPVITWIKEDGNKRNTIRTGNNTLYIAEVGEKDAGKYTCYAGSKGGLNTTDFYLTVERGAPIPMSPELMTRTFAIAVGCALAYILLFIFLMIWCKQRRRKRRMTLKEDGSKEEGPLANGLGEYHDEVAQKGDMNMTAASVQATRANYDKLQFPRHDLETIAVIGHGAYGEVSIARAQGIRDGEDATTVLVKALETKDENLQLNFRGEIDMLNKLNHENIVKLLGICKEGEPQLMITEYLDWGDLKQFLKATRGENGSTNAPPPLTYNQKVDVISQVALGMEHLSNNRFVHADLAARNCLLSPSMEVKICTMSASKDLYRNEYHEYQQRLMPVRWMPVEAIFEDELSTKSDVWSYGVFVWEVFSQGEQPYSELDNDAYMSAIVDGDLTLKTPLETPQQVEELMQRCWADCPKERPSFSDIVIAVQQLNSDSTL